MVGPSDFVCHPCPSSGVLESTGVEDICLNSSCSLFLKKIGRTGKRLTIQDQIMTLHPGAFPTWEARCKYVIRMNGLGQNEMLYLRSLAYDRVHPVTIINAEAQAVSYEERSQPVPLK